MNPQDYETWVQQARQHTQELMTAAQATFGIGSHARYEVDLATATIRFFDSADLETVQADLQVAGSWSPSAESWLWGWENQSIPHQASARVQDVRKIGEELELAHLCEAFAPCDEGEAWSMASIAAQILKAECVYRAGGAKSRVFLLLFAIRQTTN